MKLFKLWKVIHIHTESRGDYEILPAGINVFKKRSDALAMKHRAAIANVYCQHATFFQWLRGEWQ